MGPYLGISGGRGSGGAVHGGGRLEWCEA